MTERTIGFLAGFAIAASLCLAAFLNFGHIDRVSATFDKSGVMTDCVEFRIGTPATWCNDMLGR
ncbi:MAG TPA: hypothetical protein VG222_14020, partial [Vicinamibacterales bacterium]|nr:hypothetical protein [Vicinamibacterales bacterium]